MHKFITMTAFSGLLVSAMLATTPTLAQSSRSVINPTALQKKIAVILKMPHRSAKNRRRDRNRDPVRAMEFCRLKDNMKVLAWGPGRGWYTEILGPVETYSYGKLAQFKDPEGNIFGLYEPPQ